MRAQAGNCPGARHLCPHTRCDSWASPTDTDLGYSTRTRKDLQESMRLGKTHNGPPEGILATTKLSTPTSQRLQWERMCALGNREVSQEEGAEKDLENSGQAG